MRFDRIILGRFSASMPQRIGITSSSGVRLSADRVEEVKIMSSSNSQHVVPEAGEPLDSLKFEVAREVGVNLTQGYNGNLPTREAGRIGGQMVRRMIELAERNLTGTRAR
jgi:small acid-soluble spore protein D (minor alpha/beta-type SASP)